MVNAREDCISLGQLFSTHLGSRVGLGPKQKGRSKSPRKPKLLSPKKTSIGTIHKLGCILTATRKPSSKRHACKLGMTDPLIGEVSNSYSHMEGKIREAQKRKLNVDSTMQLENSNKSHEVVEDGYENMEEVLASFAL